MKLDAHGPRTGADLIPRIAVVAMVALMLAAVLRVGRPDLPRRFAIVEPGHLYRGGYHDSDGTVRRLAHEYGVRTVVTLTSDPADAQRVVQEQQAIADCDLAYFNFPMPGDGRGEFDALEAAADVLADESRHPVFFRCAAGKQRTNAVLAVYRMKYCDWPLDRALAELDEYGLDRDEEAPLIEHLRTYQRSRVAK